MSELAARIGTSQPHVSQWESNKCKPNSANAKLLADALNTTEDWLLHGIKPTVAKNSTEADTVIYLPVISDTTTMKGIGREVQHPSQVLPAMPGGPHRFYMRMKDETMTNPTGSPSIPPGAYVLIDPDLDVHSEDIIAIKLLTGTKTLIKRYIEHGNQRWLESLNPKYDPIELTNAAQIIGVVTDIQIKLR